MTAKEAKQLLVGTIVMWDGDPDDLGTVRKLSPSGFYVDWADIARDDCWIFYEDAKKVSIR